ncbi:MAG: transposase [Planctomycetia bacterium]|nr:transposase [Planctomycetia bacterium]
MRPCHGYVGPLYSCSKKHVPHVKIVFDLFHVVSGFGKLLTRYEMLNTKKRRKRTRGVFKGSKYLC